MLNLLTGQELVVYAESDLGYGLSNNGMSFMPFSSAHKYIVYVSCYPALTVLYSVVKVVKE
jgi:hypothetical protein